MDNAYLIRRVLVMAYSCDVADADCCFVFLRSEAICDPTHECVISELKERLILCIFKHKGVFKLLALAQDSRLVLTYHQPSALGYTAIAT
eukprot:1632124-Pleurochrysis_carterae.AAC.2